MYYMKQDKPKLYSTEIMYGKIIGVYNSAASIVVSMPFVKLNVMMFNNRLIIYSVYMC
jgi:hypothetical protein